MSNAFCLMRLKNDSLTGKRVCSHDKQSICLSIMQSWPAPINQSIHQYFCRKSVEKVLFVTSGQPHSSCFDYKFDLNSIAPTAGKRTRPSTRLLQQTLSWGVRSSSLKMWYPPCPSCSLDLWLTYNSPPGVAGFCLLSHTLELPSEDALSLFLSSFRLHSCYCCVLVFRSALSVVFKV